MGLVGYYGATTSWVFCWHPGLLLLPVVLLIQLLLMIGLGLWLALANLWYRDVKYLFAVGIQMWMFLTNVLYPLPDDGSRLMHLLTTANPMVPIISAYRRIILDGRWPEVGPLLTALFVAAFLSISGWMAYRALEGRFAERV